MDSWKNLRRKMEKALELFNLAEALSHLDALITTASSPSDVGSLLRQHTLRRLPTLHYLTGFTYREEDLPCMERLIRIFTEFGYDINKTLPNGVRKLASPHITALLASVKKENFMLVACLLKCGASAGINDPEGFSPCHWAVKNGNLKCLQMLLEHGGSELVTSAPADKVLPLLHAAVDLGHLDIVLYLLSKEEVDVNYEVQADSMLWWSVSSYRTTNRSFTPLGRALYKKNMPIAQALMSHPRTKPSLFTELHYFFENGDTKNALGLLEYFSDEELSTDKVGDLWALHTINPEAFSDDVGFMKKLILEYVARGWDPNSMSTFLKSMDSDEDDKEAPLMISQTLLHLACIYDSHEMIVFLVEEVGVDIQLKMAVEEYGEMTPLMLVLSEGQWKSSKYLIEKGADLNVNRKMGLLKTAEYRKYMRPMIKNLTTGDLELISSMNAVEILVTAREKKALPLLEHVLARPDVVWQGSNEFHLALEGGNPVSITKVVERCAEMISKEDLNWVTLCDGMGGEPEKVPCLVWLFHGRSQREDAGGLAGLIKIMAQLGYDMNSVRDPHRSPRRIIRTPLIFYILKTDLEQETYDLLLRTILQFDHLQLNVTDEVGRNPLEYLLFEWDRRCSYSRRVPVCWKSKVLQQPPILETVKLLLAQGLDVSGMVIGPNFVYHKGSKVFLKMLYSAGAKISEEFFTSLRMCQWGSGEDDALAKEIEELKEWMEEFDRETGFTLKQLCRLQVRKMVKCIGDLKMLDGLPKGLRGNVLDTGYGPTFPMRGG